MQLIINLSWVLLGILFYKLLSFKKNKVTGKFDLKFWILDNWRDVLLNLLLSFIIVRFYDNIVYLVGALSFVDTGLLLRIKEIEFSFFLMGYCHQTIFSYLRHTEFKKVLTEKEN